ncbi:AbgT family transporter [Tetragenococcus halophilus]|uniref:Aminobenzoyl-glutamate transporter n=3 Tax=Tetragenococcus halophilus TaxID=51669 RepID=A0A2H6CVA3_TETHA|nr:AbgT family transporter [Tetragenococcus halophilus]MDN6270359.1 AbgT family transporter [Tetragenococcus koreensis]MDN6640091.1 AbgT family transporter [Tetragenococcus sp.]MCF1602291.1 AbgT family transporter [Tetragenococcus halophilus]MCO8286014.1 AbgT family transporter [Tetragenococcus halophilus]MCO8289067.1 AbgT family transporter [Tetragenococcus halophilus]
MANKQKNFRFLNLIERAGNRLPDPSFLFIFLTLLTIIASAVAAYFNLSVTYEGFNEETGTIETITASVNNLLSVEGFQYMVTNVIDNFTGFFPLGTVFTVIIGVSVTEGTGMLSVLLKRIVSKTPKALISAMVVFLGILSNVASSTGYIVLLPLGAIIFLASKRHPVAGIAAAYAGVSGGWTANLLIGSNDPLYAGISTQAANILDPNYTVQPTGNWFFMIISTIMVTLIGTYITDKIVEPKLSTYSFTSSETVETITDDERRGLRFAGITFLIYVSLIAITIIPESGILRDPETGSLLESPFMEGIILFIMLMFLLPGIAYGVGQGAIKSTHDVAKLMSDGISGIANFLVLIFWAAQFTAFFEYSNLGTILSVNGAQLLTNIGLTGLPLLLLFVIVAALINIIMPVDTAKWAMMAPIFIPMFLQVGLSPEVTQIAYRIGDSTTNVITPLMPFFPMIIAYFQKYDKKAGIGSVISTMLPYSIAFLIGWIILLSGWYLFELPLGPGAPVTT